MGPRTHNI